jgi:hypothetical protein
MLSFEFWYAHARTRADYVGAIARVIEATCPPAEYRPPWDPPHWSDRCAREREQMFDEYERDVRRAASRARWSS